MKLSHDTTKSSGPAVEAVLRFVDDEIAKIVADIEAHRPIRPTPKPRGPRAKVQHAKAA